MQQRVAAFWFASSVIFSQAVSFVVGSALFLLTQSVLLTRFLHVGLCPVLKAQQHVHGGEHAIADSV